MYTKPFVIAFVSFAIGGTAGFLVARKLLEEHYMEQAQIEIDGVKDFYRKKYERVPEVETSKDSAESEVGKYRKLTDKYNKPDLHELANPHEEDILEDDIEEEIEEEIEEFSDDEDEEEEDDEDEDDSESGGDENMTDPYLIDYEDFTDPTSTFKKVDLYYYRFDDVMCHSDDLVIPQPEDILGWEWLNLLTTKAIAFVRNPKLATDYEIHALGKSYQTDIAGRLETDKEKKYRRLARKKEVMDSSSDEFLKLEEQAAKKRQTKKPPYTRKPRHTAKNPEDLTA
jgi:hypothetical protein